MDDKNIFQDLKYRFQFGGMHVKLLFVNAIVFIFIGFLHVFTRLLGDVEIQQSTAILLHDIFALQADFLGLITKPWGLITSIFSHFEFMHFLFNMLFLFFAGQLYEQLFGGKKLLNIYILGGIAGGILEIVAHELFPALSNSQSIVVGASGSIMAIFIAAAMYRPNTKIMLFGILPIRIIVLAGIYFIYDLLSLGMPDGTAHFAHIGGGIIGVISVKTMDKPNNILTRFARFTDKIFAIFKRDFFKKKNTLNVERGGRPLTDEEYIARKKENQAKTDAILDKISKSGYESLTSKEKEFLFKQSNKNG
jgi:membrane associated rhomboid family serine protease